MNFEEIEDRIIARLRARVPALRAVETYAGQLQGEIGKLPLRLPACYVAYEGSGIEPVDGALYREKARFTVHAVSRDLRAGREGAYALVREVLSALAGAEMGPGAERLEPMATELVYTGGGITVYGIEFAAAFDADYVEEGGD